MSSDWELKTLGEIGSFKNGANFNKNDYGDAYPVVSVKNLFRGRFATTNDLDAIKEGVINTIDDYLLQKNDILFARSSVKQSGAGQVAITNILPEKCIFSGFIIRFRVNDENEVNPLFMFYLLQSPVYRELLTRIATGTTISNLSQAALSKLPIRLPDKRTQDYIVNIVDQLDQKIELNRQVNQTLEQIAQAIFKSWFVDFEPVIAKIQAKQNGQDPERAAMRAISGKTDEQIDALSKGQHQQLTATAALFPDELEDSELGEIPKGWGAEPLGKYLGVKRGGSPRPIKDYIVKDGLPWVKIADATANNNPFVFRTKECIKEEGLKKTVYLKKGTLILSNSATPGLPRFLELDACIHDGWLHFPKRNHFSDEYLYLLFLYIRKILINKGSGSVFTNLKTDILRNQVVLVTSKEIMEEFTHTANLILNKILISSKEINMLSEVRDSMLPKLLSGEIVPGETQPTAVVVA